MNHKFIFIANNNIGYGLSGGDTIFIELTKNWQHSNKITLLACQETINILPKSINKTKIVLTDSLNKNDSNTVINLFFHYIRRIYYGCKTVLNSKNDLLNNDYVYSVSDFLPDLIPALLIKILKPKIKWIAGFYLFAPQPFSKNTPYTGSKRIKGFLYWFLQIFTRLLVDNVADIIYVTSVPDISKFSKHKKIVVVRGGIDLTKINEYIKNNPLLPVSKRKYDACFMGRFHPQKGCLILIEIWKHVVKKKPKARLAIIGQGEEEQGMRNLISKYKLENNIKIFGFLTGEPKYRIFSNSKLVVHPAIFDSGGMASAEATAFGLPGVSFHLEALTTYYPKGFIKSKCFSSLSFAKNIIKLLTNKSLYKTLSNESFELVKVHWDWEKRSIEIYNETKK